MRKFNDFDEMCVIKYHDRWVAMVYQHGTAKQVTAYYEKCDGSYATMQEAVRHIVGIELPAIEILISKARTAYLDNVAVITITKADLKTQQ